MPNDMKQQPSYVAIDEGNPAVFHPKWLVLDDVNVDLMSIAATGVALTSVVFLDFSWRVTGGLLLAFLLPLRTILPRARTPTGLVLITGASSGIGAELSYIFAERGHDLVLVGRDEGQLEAVKKNVGDKYGKNATTIAMDLSVTGSAQNLYNQVTEKGLQVDVLINNAGLGGAGDTLEQPIELSERMTILNCITPVQLSQLFGRDMASRKRGWMMQVSSVGGWVASPGQNIYHASKHFVRAFSESLSVEFRAYPGLVNTQLMPGPTQTQWVTRAHGQELFMTAASGAVEDPKAVAMAGYKGLCKGKRMVFSSWNAAGTALFMQLAPRSVHLTLASFMNAPMRGAARMEEPEKDQNVRGAKLEGNRSS